MKKLFLSIMFLCLAMTARAQSPLVTLANSMQLGTWAQLSQTNINAVLGTGPTTGNKLPFASTAKWDGAVLHYAGNDHGEEGRYITYDAATNSWTDNGQTPVHIGHNYDHISLDPISKDIYLREYGIWPGGYNVMRRHNGTWSNLPVWSGLPQVAIGTEWWSGVFQGVSNGIYLLYNCGNDNGLVTGYNPATNTWFFNLNGFGGVNTYHCIMEYSSVLNVAVFGGGNDNSKKIWRLNADRTITALTAPPTPSGIGIQRTNMVADPVTGKFLLLGDGQFWELDPAGTGTYRQLPTPPSGVGNPSAPDSVISAHLDSAGVVTYITCKTSGCTMFLYKHATGTIPPPPTDITPPIITLTAPINNTTVSGTISISATASDNVGVAGVQFQVDGTNFGVEDTAAPYASSIDTTTLLNASHVIAAKARDASNNQASVSVTVVTNNSAPPPPPASDFLTRCQAAGVVRCIGFDQASDIAGVYGSNSGILSGTTTPMLDTAVKASGQSSIKFTIPGNVATTDPGGSYFTNFSADLLTQFGAGQEFYIQWRQRFSPEYLTITGGGGPKQSIIGTGDTPGCSPSNSASGNCRASCTALEVVTQNSYNKGFPQMYNSCTGSASHGAYSPFEERFGTYDFKLQNARPSPYCLYSQGSTTPKSYLPPAGNCFGYFANEWLTYQIGITAGPRVGDEFVNSFVRMWVAREGQASEAVFNWGPYNLSAGAADANQLFGKIWLLPYNTGQSSTQGFTTAYTWYDDLIISRNRIADPSTGSTPPPQPDNMPPVVTNGPSQTVTLPNTITLTATVTDDGLPNGTLNYAWTGPTGTTLVTPNLVTTAASFIVAGSYTFTLAVSDGALTTSGTTLVTVNAEPPPPPPPTDPCIATPLTVTVTNWPATTAGSRQLRYTSSQRLDKIIIDSALTHAVFTDTRGCTDLVAKP